MFPMRRVLSHPCQAVFAASLMLICAALFHAPCGCLALSPLLYGGSSTSIVDNARAGSSNAILSSSIHRHYRPNNGNSLRPTSTAAYSSTQLSMVGGGYSLEPEQPQSQQTQQRWTESVIPELEVPTTTQQEPNSLGQIPPRPKVVVFGASGRIGRRIIKKLLNSGIDMDVVAFVRNAKKLEKVLYDEEDLVMDNLMGSNGIGGTKRSGPKLHVVVSDVVSKRDVHQQTFETNGEAQVLDDWVDKAKEYFRSKGWKNDINTTEIKSLEDDDKVASDVDILESGGEEALRDAISGSTIIISCLGSFRPSNVWTDYLRVPFIRILRKDAAQWCSDANHPYYVNYLTTKKILEEAEKEQKRREAILEFERERLLMEEQLQKGRSRANNKREEEGFESEIAARLSKMRKKRNSSLLGRQGNRGEGAVGLPQNGKLASSSDRIKFIRISNLMVGHSPFRTWNVITNILWSQLSKCELMGEMLMEASKVVDTIVLRPGDLTDDERNMNHTSLQLCIDGKVESPYLVGREDVADLAVVAALTKTTLDALQIDDANNETDSKIGDTILEGIEMPLNQSAHHYCWAMRWTGQHLSPPQGLRPDGLQSAALCFVKAIKEQTQVEKIKRDKEKTLRSYLGGKELLRLKQWRRRLKPYTQSLAISIPVYATMGFMSWYLFGQTCIDLFRRLRRLSVPGVLLKLLP